MKVDLGCDPTIFRQTNSDVLGAADPSCLICANKIDRFLAREIYFLLQLLSHFPSLLHNLAKVLWAVQWAHRYETVAALSSQFAKAKHRYQ